MFNVKEMLYSMRDDLKFIWPKFNTKTYGYKSLVYAGAKLWNSLPVTLKKCTLNFYFIYKKFSLQVLMFLKKY